MPQDLDVKVMDLVRCVMDMALRALEDKERVVVCEGLAEIEVHERCYVLALSVVLELCDEVR
jgi:hypothetical protein